MNKPRHLEPGVLIDLAEGQGSAEAQSHVEACPSCRGIVEALQATLAKAVRVEIPEPSPLFWDHFSARVARAVDREASAGGRVRNAARLARWVGVPVAVGLAAAVWFITLQPAPPVPVGDRVATTRTVVEEADEGLAGADGVWAVMTALSDDLAVDEEQRDVLTPALGTAERAIDQLSAEERSELVRLLEAELAKRSS